VDFEGATLLGYRSEILDESRHIYGFSLCWMSPDEPYAMRYPFAVSILNVDLESIADLISYTGMGRYTNWQPDKGFCDRFALALPPEPARAYSIMINLYDLKTGAMLFGSNPDGSPRQSGFIGVVAVPGEHVSAEALAAVLYSFDDSLHLLDYTITSSSDRLDFQFVWATSHANQYPAVHQYIHVFDQDDQHVAQVDFGPSTSGYPIPLWGANEQIVDQISLPIDPLPPGDYRVMTGLYFVDGLQRLPVVDANGEPVRDNNILLGMFTVEAESLDSAPP
jgi:hypothetical protein